jgi:hypothetical protein
VWSQQTSHPEDVHVLALEDAIVADVAGGAPEPAAHDLLAKQLARERADWNT